MSKLRTIVFVAVTAAFGFGLLAPVAAQETDVIYIANGVVARIRTAGTYGTLYERSAAIDKAIAEVISTQDTQHPHVRVAMKDGRWSVYCGDVRIISVYPQEAKANGVAAKTLAQMWAKNIKTRLPLTTPKSKMPPGAVLPPVTVNPPRPARAEAPAGTETTMSRSAALLLTIDAFNVVRALAEDDYLGKREEIARNLLTNLQPFMRLPGAVIEPPAVTPPPPATDRETVGPPAPPPPGEAPTPEEVYAPAEAVDTTGIPPGHENDPAYAKVPQKHRIKAKFELVRDPYLRLAASDPQAARPIGEILKAARGARTAGRFDECETYLDHVLGLLGVTAD